MDISSDPGTPPSPPFHAFERERLAAVREIEPFVLPGDRAMLSLTCEATQACDAPIGIVSLLDDECERFLACVGAHVQRMERSASICAYTILQNDVYAVEDLSADPRFVDNPAVVHEPFLRFYAGAPILDATGLPLGALCVLDTHPREVTARCLLVLPHLAALASAALEARLLLADARARYAPKLEAQAAHTRLDALLLTLVEPRPWS